MLSGVCILVILSSCLLAGGSLSQEQGTYSWILLLKCYWGVLWFVHEHATKWTRNQGARYGEDASTWTAALCLVGALHVYVEDSLMYGLLSLSQQLPHLIIAGFTQGCYKGGRWCLPLLPSSSVSNQTSLTGCVTKGRTKPEKVSLRAMSTGGALW